MSIRNEEIGDLVLAATRRCLLRNGGRKVTLAEVAREAGVSRPTVYRRWPDVSEIVRALLTREVLDTVALAGWDDPADDLDAVVDRMVRVVGLLRGNALIASLWREQREFMAPYVFDRLGASQQGILALLADVIAEAQDRGDARPGDAKQMAALVLLVTQSFLQSAALVSDILADGWEPELHRVLVGYLRPLHGGR